MKRRNLLICLGIGSTLDKWYKPVISSVVLPVHAMTSTALRLDPIADIFLSCGDNRNQNPSCSADDSRIRVERFVSSLNNFIIFNMDIVYGQNIDENASYSLVNDPTEANGELGRLYFPGGSGPALEWNFGFPGNGPPNSDDEIPIDTFNLIIRVENSNGESATTAVNITFN